MSIPLFLPSDFQNKHNNLELDFNLKKIILSFIFLYTGVFAHPVRLTGKVIDTSTGKGVGYSIIRIANTYKCTNSNYEGDFEVALPDTDCLLVTECIGFKPDTLKIKSDETQGDLNIYLERLDCRKTISENISSPSTLIAKVISEKEKVFNDLLSYKFDAYTRCVTRENNDIGLASGSIRINPRIVTGAFNLISNIWKSKPMKIDGIAEFISKGYYRKPDSYNEVVVSQTSYLPPSLKALLGTRSVQNLCNDELLFFNRSLPGPLSANALSWYGYSFEDTLQINNECLYKIHFEPLDKSDPGLIGDLYIAGSSGSVLKIEAKLNEAANDGNNFDSVIVSQQFIKYYDHYYLPINYLMSVKSDYIGIVKIQYDYNALIENYEINRNDSEENGENKSFASLPENRGTDSLWWSDQRAVPLTREEAAAYEKTSGLRSAPGGFFYRAARIFSPQYKLNNNFSISGPLGIYQFNHVEGHTLSLTGSGNGLFNNSLDARITLSNGFSDRRFKENVSGAYMLNDGKTFKFSFNAYNKLEPLFSSSDRYNSITSTIFSLLSNRDFRNYYYKKGFDLQTDAELASFVRFYVSYSNHSDYSAKTNTTFSLFGNRYRNFSKRNNIDFPDSVNIPIFDAHLSTISLGVNFDFRDDVLENNIKRKVSNGHSFISFGAGLLISSPEFLKSDIGFISYNSNIFGELNTFGTSSLGISINAIYSKGPVPIQMQYALPGNISATGREFTFRTIGVGRTFGDQVLTLNLEYNLRKEISRVLPFSFLRNVSLSSFFNTAWKNMSSKSAAIMPIVYSLMTKPLMETGFSIGYSSLPVNLEFAWRLTQIERNGFNIGINTSIL